MPTKKEFSINANRVKADLSKNSLIISHAKKERPNYWSNGYVNSTGKFADYKYTTYPTNINGDKIGEVRELRLNEDFVLEDLSDDNVYRYRVKFLNSFSELLVVSGTEELDYSQFVPETNGYPNYNYISLMSSATVYPGMLPTIPSYLKEIGGTRTPYSASQIYVSAVGYLGFGAVDTTADIKDKEPILSTTFYINGTKTLLKKGSKFTVSAKHLDILNVQPKRSQEFKLTLSDTGRLTEGTKVPLENWDIINTDPYGDIMLVYKGEDTREIQGVTIFTGFDYSIDTSERLILTLSDDMYQVDHDVRTNVYYKMTNKEGQFTLDNREIKWTINANLFYQELKQATDTFAYGVEKGSMKNLVVTTIGFGQFGATKTLKENVDYKVNLTDDGFTLDFLTKITDKVVVRYVTKTDLSTLDYNSRAKNTIETTAQFEVAKKSLAVDGYAFIPSFLRDNIPQLIQKNTISERELLGQQPINKLKLLINPAGLSQENSQIKVDLSSIDIEVLKEQFEVHTVSELGANYNSLVLGAKITEKALDYPEISRDGSILTVKNKQLTQPIVIEFTVGKQNYYNITSDKTPVTYSSNLSPWDRTATTTLYFGRKLEEKLTLENNPDYPNVGDLKLTIPKIEGHALVKGTRIHFRLTGGGTPQFSTNLIEVTNLKGEKLATNVIKLNTNSSPSYIEINSADLTEGLKVNIPAIFKVSGKVQMVSDSSTGYYPVENNSTNYQAYTYIKHNGSITVDTSGAGGEGSLILTDLNLQAVDKQTGTPLAGAEFELRTKDGKVLATAVSDGKGQVLFKDVPVTTYYIVETKAPAGYLINPEYAGQGKEIQLKETATEYKVTVPHGLLATLKVNFVYPDGTPLTEVEAVTISKDAGTVINLKEETEVLKNLQTMASLSPSYRLVEFDKGQVEGHEEALLMPSGMEEVYYRYEGLVDLKVPQFLEFKPGFISSFNQKLEAKKDQAFVLTIKDHRQTTTTETTSASNVRGNISVQARLTQEFQVTSDKVLKNARLIYRKGTQDILLNGAGGEVVKLEQDQSNPETKHFEVILDRKGQADGFRLEVPAGNVLTQEYHGIITWNVIDGL